MKRFVNIHRFHSGDGRKWLVWKRSFLLQRGTVRLRVMFNLTFWRKWDHPVFEFLFRMPDGYELVKTQA